MSSSSDPTNPQNKNPNTQQEQPSIISGHAEYIKGSAEVSPSQTSSQTLTYTRSPFLLYSPSWSPSSTPPPCSNPNSTPSLADLHRRNRQLRKMKRIRDSRGNHADVMFVANLSSAQSAIGNITGSHAWTTSGEQDKAHARANLKAAAEGRDAEGKGYGHAEEVAGRWTGCEGMKEEGRASAEREKGSKRQD